MDEVIEQQLFQKGKTELNYNSKAKKLGRFIFRRWFYLLIAGLVATFITFGFSKITNYFSSPRDKTIEIGNSSYVLSKDAQKYLRVYEVSDYEKIKSLIIIEEPHYNIESQFSLFKGLELFFRDNPTLVNQTVFLSEGIPSNQIVSVRPLIDVNPYPDENLIKEVLGTFLITGYIAYEWKYQKNIPIVGIEDENLYNLCATQWIKMQEDKNNQEEAEYWYTTVAARNKSIANTLIEKTRRYENPILFVGGQHLKKLRSNEFKSAKYCSYDNSQNQQAVVYQEENENLGIYDYLKEDRIGYTFIISKPCRLESPRDLEKNTNAYTKLFKAQQSGDYSDYIEWFISEKNVAGNVTVSPSTEAAAQFVKASAEKKGEKKGDKDRNKDKNKDKDKKDGKKDNGNGGDGKDGDGKKPQEVTLKGDKIEEGRTISEKEAAERAKSGKDVKANGREQAERIARDAGNGKDPIHESPHKPGYRPHYHPNGHGKAHVFY